MGDELIGLRQAAGYSGVQMARKLGWEQSRLNRIENGKYHTTEVDITQWVTILGHPRPVLDNLLAMLRQSEEGFVLQPHGVRLPDQLHTLIRYETSAQAIKNFQLAIVPGLLQTKAYAEALLTDGGMVPSHRIDGLVQARMDRQCMFSRLKQPECTFYIHEFALRLVVGGSRVMNDQLMHLAFMANTYGVSIRVIPASVGTHAGLCGAFSLMEYADEHQLPVVCTELIGASIFMDESSLVAAHRAVLESLDRVAMDEGQSRLWLVNLASEYDPPSGDDPHALGLPDLA